MGQWRRRKSEFIKYSILVTLICILQYTQATEHSKNLTTLDEKLIKYVDEIFSLDNYKILPGLELEKKEINGTNETFRGYNEYETDNVVQEYFYKRMDNFINSHVLSLNVPQTARFLVPCKYLF